MARQKLRLRDDKDKVKDANRELRAQVRQLRKQLNAALKELDDLRDALREESYPTPPTVEVRGPTCKHCKSDNIVVIPTGVKNVVNCLGCGKKYTTERVDNENDIPKSHGR